MLIDTLNAQKRLVEEYGFEERTAKGIVEVISSTEDRVATTQDMEAQIEAFEARLTRTMYGVAFLIVTVLGALNFFT